MNKIEDSKVIYVKRTYNIIDNGYNGDTHIGVYSNKKTEDTNAVRYVQADLIPLWVQPDTDNKYPYPFDKVCVLLKNYSVTVAFMDQNKKWWRAETGELIEDGIFYWLSFPKSAFGYTSYNNPIQVIEKDLESR